MSPPPSPYTQFTSLLSEKAPFVDLEAALAILEYVVEDVGKAPLTLLGELMRFESGMLPADCRSVLWLNFEFLTSEAMEKYKELRMRPFAITGSDVGHVRSLHLPFRSRGWKEVTKNWLTLTDVISYFETRYERSFEFCVLLLGRRVELSTFEGTDWFQSDRMLVLYCEDGRYFAKYKSIAEPVEISSLQVGGKEMRAFTDWLREFRVLTKKHVEVYLGCTPPLHNGLRVWSAMTGTVAYQHLMGVKSIAHLFQSELFPQLQASLATGDLDRFWDMTAKATHTSIDDGDQDPALKIFLGMKPEEPWPADLTPTEVRDALKSLCGQLSCFHGDPGDRPFVALGVVFLLIGAIAKKRIGGLPELSERLTLDQPKVLSRSACTLPRQSQDLAKRTVRALLDLFMLIVTDDQTGKLLITRVHATAETIEIDTLIPAFHSPKPGHLSLMDGLRLALHRTSDLHVGQVAMAIRSYMDLARSSDLPAIESKSSKSVPAFLISGLEVDITGDNFLRLQVKAWT